MLHWQVTSCVSFQRRQALFEVNKSGVVVVLCHVVNRIRLCVRWVTNEIEHLRREEHEDECAENERAAASQLGGVILPVLVSHLGSDSERVD